LRPLNLIGATDLSMLAAVLVHCRTLVTNDSGAMIPAAWGSTWRPCSVQRMKLRRGRLNRPHVGRSRRVVPPLHAA
jgi:hypothetical protein